MKSLYKDYSEKEYLPIFFQPWWLDTLAGQENWEAVVAKKNDEIIGVMPYSISKKFFFKTIKMPPLTQFLGPWIVYPDIKGSNKLSIDKAVMTELISKLPNFHKFSQCWNYLYKNWLPFYWKDFKQTTKYTYVLDYKCKLDEIWSSIKPNIKSDIQKAQKKYNLVIDENPNIEDFINLNKLVFERQGMISPYSDKSIRNIYSETLLRNSGKLFLAKDKHNNFHAGVFIIWDKKSAYYLLGGGDPDLRGSGATSFCLWEAIKYCSDKTEKFDFEGSMIEPIEKFIRAFGAKQFPYFLIEKTPSKFYRLFAAAKKSLKK